MLVTYITLATLIVVLLPLYTRFFAALPGAGAAPFECGFEPAGSTTVPFCPKFWVIAILFLLFDVEVALLIPIRASLSVGICFVLALVLGASYEFCAGSLDWAV